MKERPPLVTVPPDPNLSFADRARAAGAKSFGVAQADLDLDTPIALTPSPCVEIAVSVRERFDGDKRWFVQLPDGTLVPGGGGEALALVSRRCFLDNGILPDQDTAVTLALTVGGRRSLMELGDRAGPRLLGEVGEEWSPPTVTPNDDGFVVSFNAQDPYSGSFYRVTSTVEGDSATTEFEKIG